MLIKTKIKTKLLLILFGVGLLPAAVFGFWNIYSAEQALKTEILSRLLVLAESKEGQIFAYLDFLESRAGSFASDGVIRSELEEIITKGSKQAVGLLNQHLILNKLPVDKTIVGILVMDTVGRVVAATDPEEIGGNEAKDAYFIEGLINVSSVELRGEEHFGILDSFAASAPIINRETGKVLGVIAIFFKTDKLRDVLSGEFQKQKGALTSNGGIDKTLEIYIVDKEKRMFVHPREHTGHDGELPPEMIVNTDPIKKCLEHKEETLSTYRNYKGEEVLGASMCFVEKGWTLLAEVHTDEALTAINRMWILLSITSILFLAFVTVFAEFFGRKISDPIKKLHDGSEIIGEGKLDYRLDIRTGDELEQLGGAFNQMAERLGQRTREKQEEEARLSASINALSFGFVIADMQHRVLLKNKAMMELFGLDGREETSIESISKLLGKDFDVKTEAERCLKGKITCEIKEIVFGAKFLRGIFAPIIMVRDHEEIIGYVFLLEDITERKILERGKEEFFAVASHELRTPLTAIRGNMSLIKENYADKIEDKNIMDMVEDSYGASVRLIGIVNDFLDVSSLEFGKTKFKIEKVDAVNLIKEIIHEINGRMKLKNLELKLTLPDEPVWVSADKGRVKQVLSNLLNNAVNYTQKGEIGIELKKDGAFCQISVSDTGMGILPQNHNLLFRKFQQAGEKILARDVTQGSGLGLYISKLLVGQMGGTIELIKSAPGIGSTFAFTLPIAV